VQAHGVGQQALAQARVLRHQHQGRKALRAHIRTVHTALKVQVQGVLRPAQRVAQQLVEHAISQAGQRPQLGLGPVGWLGAARGPGGSGAARRCAELGFATACIF
jgi:hypothetical protein